MTGEYGDIPNLLGAMKCGFAVAVRGVGGASIASFRFSHQTSATTNYWSVETLRSSRPFPSQKCFRFFYDGAYRKSIFFKVSVLISQFKGYER